MRTLIEFVKVLDAREDAEQAHFSNFKWDLHGVHMYHMSNGIDHTLFESAKSYRIREGLGCLRASLIEFVKVSDA